MNIWTKFFVVLVTFLAIVLVALVVPFVANTEVKTSQITALEQQLKVANAAARERSEQIKTLAQQQSETIADLRERERTLGDELIGIAAENSGLETRLSQMKAERDRLEVDNRTQMSLAEQSAKLVSEFRQELESSRQDMLSQQTRLIELADANNQLQTQFETLTREFRRLQEQSTELRDENARLYAALDRLPPDVRSQALAGESGGSQEAPPHWGAQTIRGVVTGVESFEGDTFVKINVGDADGVQQKMKFLVHRGDNFIGNLVVEQVSERESAGVVRLQQGSVQVGDSVLTGGMN